MAFLSINSIHVVRKIAPISVPSIHTTAQARLLAPVVDSGPLLAALSVRLPLVYSPRVPSTCTSTLYAGPRLRAHLHMQLEGNKTNPSPSRRDCNADAANQQH